MKYLRVLTILIGLILAVTASAQQQTCAPRADQGYKKLIVGTWKEAPTIVISGQELYSVTTFYSNGVFSGKLMRSSDNSDIGMQILGNWKIQNGKLYKDSTKTTPESFANEIGAIHSVDTLKCMSTKGLYISLCKCSKLMVHSGSVSSAHHSSKIPQHPGILEAILSAHQNYRFQRLALPVFRSTLYTKRLKITKCIFQQAVPVFKV